MQDPNRRFFTEDPKTAFTAGVVCTVAVLGVVGTFFFASISVGDKPLVGKADVPLAVAQDDGAVVQQADPQEQVAPPATPPPAVTDADHLRGNKDALITLVEYSDYQCPFCSRFHPTMKQIVEKYDGKVNWVFRHFPLSFHPNAEPAAEAAECASEQGKFWEFSDALFERQDELGDALYSELAGTFKMDVAGFEACLKSDKYLARVRNDLQLGSDAGVNGTPGTFLVDASGNAQLISGALPVEAFESYIDAALGK